MTTLFNRKGQVVQDPAIVKKLFESPLAGWLWRGRRPVRTAAVGAAGLYARLVEMVVKPLGLHPRPEQTPRELAEATTALLKGQAATVPLAALPGQVVELLYRARWGGQPVAELF